ncbi:MULTISPECIES: cupin domain-containing protein [Niastella]|uniref:Cupin domain-containing protein n=1 Tax=Niastella soli TaxID=2821487 RepID=A0ABS3Z1T6_9BACT|nr:cupin domain-containing protein [Niastella soli]MBO9204127.1 cupin domain-containing protein [Niastella soli]
MKPIFLTITVLFSLFCQAQPVPVTSRLFAWKDLVVQKDSSSYFMKLANGPTATLANLEMRVVELDPGKQPHAPLAHPDAEELIIVKEGNLKVTAKGLSTIIGPGGVALIMPGDIHTFESTSKVLTAYYSIRFKPTTFLNIERGNQAGGSFAGDWENWSVQQNEKGERRAVFERFTAAFEKMELHVTTLNGGLISHSPHKHSQEELIVVRKGNGIVLLGDATQPVGEGDVIFFSSNSLHSLKNTGTEPLEYFALQFQ